MFNHTHAANGFSRIELLVLVMLLGIGSAVAAPNLANAVERQKQKKTMGDMKTLASTVEQFNTDSNCYPQQAFRPLSPDAGIYAPFDEKRHAGGLTPDYIVNPIWLDGWERPFLYGTPDDGNYMLCSRASNGEVDAVKDAFPAGCVALPAQDLKNPWEAKPGDGATFDCDISIVDGQFIQAPAGRQFATLGCAAPKTLPPE